jgi:hypothetical protein
MPNWRFLPAFYSKKMTEKKKILSKEKIKKYILHKMEKGVWIRFTDVKGLDKQYIFDFKHIIMEMIDDSDYEDQPIWIELSNDYQAFKIFNNSGFKKHINGKIDKGGI